MKRPIFKGKAICVACGVFKKHATCTCPACGFTPNTDYELARAFALSEKFTIGDHTIGRSIDELKVLSTAIQRDHPYPIDAIEQSRIIELVTQHLKVLSDQRKNSQRMIILGGCTAVVFASIVFGFWYFYH